MKTVLLTIILIFSMIVTANSGEAPKQRPKNRQSLAKMDTIDMYQDVIDYLKLKEGYKGRIYLDINDYPTIGYGCMVEYLPFKVDSTTYLSKAQAEQLLKDRFEVYKKQVLKYYPKAKYNQLLALTHIAYTLGIGRVHKVYKDGKLNEERLLQYWFTPTRQWEIDLFNLD